MATVTWSRRPRRARARAAKLAIQHFHWQALHIKNQMVKEIVGRTEARVFLSTSSISMFVLRWHLGQVFVASCGEKIHDG